MKRFVVLAAVVVVIAAAAWYILPKLPMFQRANGVMVLGEAAQVDEVVEEYGDEIKKEAYYEVKEHESGAILMSLDVAKTVIEEEGMIRMLDPDNPERKITLDDLPELPKDADGWLLSAPDSIEGMNQALASPDLRLKHLGDYFFGSLRLSERAIVIVDAQRYEQLTGEPRKLGLLRLKHEVVLKMANQANEDLAIRMVTLN